MNPSDPLTISDIAGQTGFFSFVTANCLGKENSDFKPT